jgi:hypothetical protein
MGYRYGYGSPTIMVRCMISAARQLLLRAGLGNELRVEMVADACTFAIRRKLMKTSDGKYYFGPITSFNGVGTAAVTDAVDHPGGVLPLGASLNKTSLPALLHRQQASRTMSRNKSWREHAIDGMRIQACAARTAV